MSTGTDLTLAEHAMILLAEDDWLSQAMVEIREGTREVKADTALRIRNRISFVAYQVRNTGKPSHCREAAKCWFDGDDLAMMAAAAELIEKAQSAKRLAERGDLRSVVVYIAGPYRNSNWGDVLCTVARAMDAAAEILRMGYSMICPHSMTHSFEM